MAFYLLLDAVGGLLMAFAVLYFLSWRKAKKFKYRIPGTIKQLNVGVDSVKFLVEFEFGGKKLSREFTKPVPGKNELQKATHMENFEKYYRVGSKYLLMCETPDASTDVIPYNNPKFQMVLCLILVILFHASAFLFMGSPFYSVSF